MASKIQIRRDTAANWTSANPILAIGEIGYETDTGKLKIGDGVTVWASVAYFTSIPAAHLLGGAEHSADTLANLNAKVSDATLIDTADARLSDARTPTAHALGGAEHSADTLANLNSKVSDATLIDTGDARLSDARTPTSHAFAGAEHSASTLASVNTKVSDATLIDTADSRLSDARTPTAHALGGAEHSADTLANLNSKVSDATLIDTGDSRLSDDRNDADAIHDNVASEISVVTEKVTPVSGDFLLIEDSAAANVKKRVQVGNLPSGGGGVFGSEHTYGESLSISSTTSTTYIQKLKVTTASVPAGDYYIAWSGEQLTDKASVAVGHRVQVDDTTTLIEPLHKKVGAGEWEPFGGSGEVTLTAAAHDVDLDHLTAAGTGVGSQIRNVRIAIWRVS